VIHVARLDKKGFLEEVGWNSVLQVGKDQTGERTGQLSQ
jgi:hypothetical protein